MIKTGKKKIEGNLPNLIKYTYKNPAANIIVKD